MAKSRDIINRSFMQAAVLAFILLCLNFPSCISKNDVESVEAVIEEVVVPLPSDPGLLNEYCSCIDTLLAIQTIQKSPHNDPVIPVLTQKELIKKWGVKKVKTSFGRGWWKEYYDPKGSNTKWEVFIAGDVPELTESTTRYGYDDKGRVLSEKYHDGEVGGLRANYEYYYEPNGDRIIRELRNFKSKGEDNSVSEILYHFESDYSLPILTTYYVDGELYVRTYFDTIKKTNSEYDILNVRKDFYNSRDLNVLEIFYFDDSYLGCISHEYTKNGWLKKYMARFETRTELIHYEYNASGYLIKSTDTTNYDHSIEATVSVHTYAYFENHLMSQSTVTYDGVDIDTSYYEYAFYE